MKNPFKLKSRLRNSRALGTSNSDFLFEYLSIATGPPDYDVLSPKTSLSVVFDAGTQLRHSSVRFVLYCSPELRARIENLCIIRQLGPVIRHAHEAHLAPLNNPSTLPQLTVPFEVTFNADYSCCELVSRCSDDELRTWNSKPVCILLESDCQISPDTMSLSLDIKHSIMLDTSMFSPVGFFTTTRVVRVIPLDDTRLRNSIPSLPTEILLQIFDATGPDKWQQNLLSFAQVCRRWSSCSLTFLFARLDSIRLEAKQPVEYLDTYAFASALGSVPALGLGVQHLHLDEHNCYQRFMSCSSNYLKSLSGFSPLATAIIRTTKNLERLDLSLGCSQGSTFFSTLPELHNLHTLSITMTKCLWDNLSRISSRRDYTISTFHLARCMARWSALKSLTIERMKPGNIGMKQILLRSPRCMLAQLCIRDTHISNEDLLYLTSSSASTLSRVTLENIDGLTNRGLFSFLNAVTKTLVSLTVHDITSPLGREEVHALDVLVDKMRCLEALSIRGDVASELMLRRRSSMFVKCGCNSGLPMVRLSSQSVPKLRGGSEWPGWQVVEFK